MGALFKDFSERLGPFVKIETAFHFGVFPTMSSNLAEKYCDKPVLVERFGTLHGMARFVNPSEQLSGFTGMPLHVLECKAIRSAPSQTITKIQKIHQKRIISVETVQSGACR